MSNRSIYRSIKTHIFDILFISIVLLLAGDYFINNMTQDKESFIIDRFAQIKSFIEFFARK